MFGGKKEKALEEELLAVKEQLAQRDEQLLQITKWQDSITEQFARLTASHAQMEEYIKLMEGGMEQVSELAQGNERVAGEVYGGIIEMNNAVGTFDVNHSVFVRQKKEQDEKIMEIVENNKHYTTPMKYISETPGILKEETQKVHERITKMIELSKNMGVLALNAAIEAGRMGEVGAKFIASAEKIRTFAEDYEKEATELGEQLQKTEERTQNLGEQAHHLNELLKENNISMGKLMKDGMMSMASYEAGQIELRSTFKEDAVGKTDALRQSEKEILQLQEQMGQQIKQVLEEMLEQKSSADELETILKELAQLANKGETV